jgi:hypothetical protein
VSELQQLDYFQEEGACETFGGTDYLGKHIGKIRSSIFLV